MESRKVLDFDKPTDGNKTLRESHTKAIYSSNSDSDTYLTVIKYGISHSKTDEDGVCAAQTVVKYNSGSNERHANKILHTETAGPDASITSDNIVHSDLDKADYVPFEPDGNRFLCPIAKALTRKDTCNVGDADCKNAFDENNHGIYMDFSVPKYRTQTTKLPLQITSRNLSAEHVSTTTPDSMYTDITLDENDANFGNIKTKPKSKKTESINSSPEDNNTLMSISAKNGEFAYENYREYESTETETECNKPGAIGFLPEDCHNYKDSYTWKRNDVIAVSQTSVSQRTQCINTDTFIVQMIQCPCQDRMRTGAFYLTAAENGLKLLNISQKQVQFWPYTGIRKYATTNKTFSFEAGRACEQGPGWYAFKADQPKKILDCALKVEKP